MVDKFEEFFRVVYEKELAEYIATHPDARSIVIDFAKLEAYDYELADALLDNPDKYLDAMEYALGRIEVPGLENRKLRVRVTNIPDERKLLVRNITADYIGKMVAAEGIVRQTTMVLPKLKVAKWSCRKCGRTYDIVQDGQKLKKPPVCVCGSRDFELLPDQSIWVDFQRIQIQEPIEFLRGGEQARFIDIYLEGDLTNKVKPGDRVNVVGILRLVTPDGRRTVYGKYIDALWVEPTQKEFEELEPTPEEIEQIKELAKDPEIYEKLKKSIAPTIYGHDDIKEAVALQLFGGVKKELPDGTHIRGNIHILLMGDPGTGKSQILRHAAKIAPKSIYVAGKTASGAGLTATAEKDEMGEGGWVIKAGALVLASGGVAAVDEFDKIDQKDRAALHEAMEQQTISVAKAGIVTTFKADTAILAAANPKRGRFDPYQNPIEQINIEPTILSRFDLMFIVKEKLDEDRDRKIAEHILKTHLAGEKRMAYEKGTDEQLTAEEVEEAEKHVKPPIDIELLRKYIAYARVHVVPELTKEAMDKIVDFYVNLRKLGKQQNTVPTTARQLEALIRLAEASARVRLADKITVEDADRAIRLAQASMEEVLKDPETGAIDFDVLTTGETKSKREKAKIVLNIVRAKCIDTDAVSVDEVIEEAVNSYNMDREEVREILEKLKKEGDLFEPRHGLIAPT
ncbi:MAG: minichromosome maintenance protein MCM [Candidatus Diapherotrites archaeon]|nr:minichromosome maintenance protein MCM [Candidatus Diapherotrites archaeon]